MPRIFHASHSLITRKHYTKHSENVSTHFNVIKGGVTVMPFFWWCADQQISTAVFADQSFKKIAITLICCVICTPFVRTLRYHRSSVPLRVCANGTHISQLDVISSIRSSYVLFNFLHIFLGGEYQCNTILDRRRDGEVSNRPVVDHCHLR